MLLDPLARKETQRLKLSLRSHLTQQGRKVQHKAAAALQHPEDVDALRFHLGAISTYLDTRQALLPAIASDGTVGQLKGLQAKIRDCLRKEEGDSSAP